MQCIINMHCIIFLYNSVCKLNFGIDKVTFWQNENSNCEMWYTKADTGLDMALFFSKDLIGVYDVKTQSLKSVHLS